MTLLGQHFRRRREERKLRLSKVAGLAGYRNITKGVNRILEFERHGEVHDGLLKKLASLLEIDDESIRRLAEEDRRLFLHDWNQWADQEIGPYLVVRLIAAVYRHEELPLNIESADAAEAFAIARAKELQLKVCLVVSRRLSLWIDEHGEVYERTEAVPGEANSPWMSLKGSRKTFLVRSLTRDDFVRQVEWPQQRGRKPQ